MPPWLHAFFGVSRVRFSTHFWASAAGYALPLLAVSYFGQRWVEAMRRAPPWVWAATAAAAVALGAGLWAHGRRRARAVEAR